jgi:hypothetical protein
VRRTSAGAAGTHGGCLCCPRAERDQKPL